MTHKQRVHAALARKPVDRVPVFMWFHPLTAEKLAAALEIPVSKVGEAMGDDVIQAWVGNNFAMEGVVHEKEGGSHVDQWGIEWVREGLFNQICRSPLENVGDSEIADYEFPSEHIPQLVRSMDRIACVYGEYFIGSDVSPCVFEMLNRLRGMENCLIDLAAKSEPFLALLKKAGDFSCALSEMACSSYKLDWLWTGDDVGGQQSMMMSPECWRELVKPQLARVVMVGKKHGLWVAYHSCGSIRPIIPDLIEIGIDVLNPVQGNCPGMDPFELKEEFGKNLAFMGGVDTQELLPKGTSAEVRRKTEELLSAMTCDGGGYIMAASHTVPPETPLENIFAMYEAAGISRENIFDSAAEIRRRPAVSSMKNK